jgi:uncharacterized RDD family membrane protein YckC
MTTTVDGYIDRVLDHLPRATPHREQIAMELRGTIAERLAHGQPLGDVLQQLGDPAALAESYLAAVPLESATFASRAAAKLVDFLAVAALLTVVIAAIAIALLQWRIAPLESLVPLMLFGGLAGSSLLLPIYTMVAEARTGQTLGKRVMKLRVVRESGASISGGQAIVRQLPVFLQVYVIDVLFALFTEKSQRAFELLSKTRVVVAMLLATVVLPQSLGAMPAVALSRSLDAAPAMHAVHASIAQLSSRGRHIGVPASGHEIHLFNRPAVVPPGENAKWAMQNAKRLAGVPSR